MAAGHYQEYDLFTDKETREQADIQRRELAERVQAFLMDNTQHPPANVQVTQLVRSYTIAFSTADGGNGMVLIWSARNLALTFQSAECHLSPETDVLHTLDELFKSLEIILHKHKA
jgi:hypothetical protein